MRYGRFYRKLNRSSSHRLSMFKNMLNSIIKYEIIRTTFPKAKELSRYLDSIINLSKVNNLNNKRLIFSYIRNRENLLKLFSDIGPRFITCSGGYTRVIRCGFRKGDNALMAYIQILSKNK